jgi:hypothetical protein
MKIVKGLMGTPSIYRVIEGSQRHRLLRSPYRGLGNATKAPRVPAGRVKSKEFILSPESFSSLEAEAPNIIQAPMPYLPPLPPRHLPTRKKGSTREEISFRITRMRLNGGCCIPNSYMLTERRGSIKEGKERESFRCFFLFLWKEPEIQKSKPERKDAI